MDQETHILTIERELDREQKPNHTIFVRATENCAASPKNFNVQNLTFHKNDFEASGDNEPLSIYPLRMTSNYRRNPGSKYESHFDRYKHSRHLRSLNENFIPVNLPIAGADSINLIDEESLMADGTVVRIVIRVLDLNDNPPKFRTKKFTGGFTTNADFGYKFMRLEVIISLVI